MSGEIYWFSGTGNSLSIARALAGKLNAALIPIPAIMGKGEIEPAADVVGIVFPVYYGGAPAIVRNFAGRLTGLGGKYVFAVCNFGGAAGSSLKTLRRILALRGGRLSAGYGIHMPQNAFHKPSEKYDRIYARCARRLDAVVRNAQGGKTGYFPENLVHELLFTAIFSLFKPMVRKNFLKLTGAPPETDTDTLTALLDGNFTADESCSGCGVCEKVCPVANIALESGRPVWLHRCENCLACYNFCPNKAIRGSIAHEGYHYRHPSATPGDMAGARRLQTEQETEAHDESC